jgi:signal peptidase I
MPSNAMLPNYDRNTWIIASKLKTFSYNDVVCFELLNASKSNAGITIQRVVALEGDTVEINDGYLLRNGFMADVPKKLMFNYTVKRKVVKNLDKFKKLKEKPVIQGDTILLSLSWNEKEELERFYVLNKLNKPKRQKTPSIFGSTEENCWNASNYGPTIVPKGFCFVLGDNRDNAQDSRCFGFVPVKDIVGTSLTPDPSPKERGVSPVVDLVTPFKK